MSAALIRLVALSSVLVLLHFTTELAFAAKPGPDCGNPSDIHDQWVIGSPEQQGFDPAVLCAMGKGVLDKAAAEAAEQQQQSNGSPINNSQFTAGATLVGSYGDWGAYSAYKNGKVCFAITRSSSQSFLFISTRPAENVHNEVSLVMGYDFKPNTDATVEIGPMKLALYTQKAGAWINNPAEGGRLVQAMRSSTADIIVRGTSARGGDSTDHYSPKGLGQALDRIAQECRVSGVAAAR
jgi:hypothetical protein